MEVLDIAQLFREAGWGAFVGFFAGASLWLAPYLRRWRNGRNGKPMTTADFKRAEAERDERNAEAARQQLIQQQLDQIQRNTEILQTELEERKEALRELGNLDQMAKKWTGILDAYYERKDRAQREGDAA